MRDTKSAELRVSSSKQTSTGTPADINSVPIAPSPQRTEPDNSSKKSITVQFVGRYLNWSEESFI